VTTKDGNVWRNRVAINRGNPDAPLSNADIQAKFFENCGLYFSPSHTQDLFNAVMEIDQKNDCLALEQLITLTSL
jgi:hypothetical protein